MAFGVVVLTNDVQDKNLLLGATWRPDILVVLSNGYDEAHVMEEGAHAERPQAFLRKPYSMAELKAALGAAVADLSARSRESD